MESLQQEIFGLLKKLFNESGKLITWPQKEMKSETNLYSPRTANVQGDLI
jgi:hypothetical protein